MVHVHGASAAAVTARSAGVALERCVAVPVDVGKASAAAMVVDFTGRRLVAPFTFAMNRPGVAAFTARVAAATPPDAVLVRAGVEACGHYHRPLVGPGVLPGDWQVLELNPAWVKAQRKVNGSARRKTDALDLVAIADLLLAGRGYVAARDHQALVELAGWVAHRARRVAVRTATKNQLIGQADRCFPGLSSSLSSVTDTKVGRLILDEFTDPARLAALGVARFRAFAARRGVAVSVTIAQRLVDAARDALPTADAAVAREVLAADLVLLGDLGAQIAVADAHIGELVAASRYRVLTSVPGWGALRVGALAAAAGDPARWPSHRQLYRAAGLTPAQYESAGRRRDSAISREGSVPLRRALLDLGIGLWHRDRAAAAYAATLRGRGKPGGIILTALARRAAKIAVAMLRDQTLYDPACWPVEAQED